MPLSDPQGAAAYLTILIAAILEGEIVFVAAATLVGQGQLNPIGVILAGAAGASIGDQFAFYLLRGRFSRWLNRFPAIALQGERLAAHVRRNETLTIMAIRFSPGLRLALAAACAYAGVPAIKFSVLDAGASVIWAVALIAIVAWAGPAFVQELGLSRWWGAVVPAALIVILARGMARRQRGRMSEGERVRKE